MDKGSVGPLIFEWEKTAISIVLFYGSIIHSKR